MSAVSSSLPHESAPVHHRASVHYSAPAVQQTERVGQARGLRRALSPPLALTLYALLTATAPAQIPDLSHPVSTDARIQLFQSWVAADPANTSNQTLLAGAYLQKTRETNDFNYLDRASKLVTQVLAVKPDYEAQTLRVLIELTYHHFTQAATYARELTAAVPSDPQLWGSLGDALLEMGDVAGARTAFQKMLDLRPSLFSYNRMAYLQFITGDTAEAIAMMRKAVDAGAEFPENKAWCAVELGHLYFKAGQLDAAQAAYQEALDTFPASHQAHAGLASVAAARGQVDTAIEHYLAAQAISPMVKYAGALYDLYTARGDTEQATAQAERVDLALALDESSGQAANRTLALIFANQDRNLEKALAIARADFATRAGVYTEDALAWVLYKNGLYQEAAQAAQHVAAAGTPDPLFYYHRGMIDHALGHDAAARQHLKAALSLNPGFDPAQAKVARQTLAALSH